jgi:hypothetical protein
MPIFLLFVGVLLLVSAYRGTYACLFALIKQDVTIQFGAWFVAVLLIGAIGYVKKLEPISNALLALVIVVLLLTKQGIWTQLTQAVGTIGSQAGVTPASASTAVGSAAPVIPFPSAVPLAGSDTSGSSGSDTSSVVHYSLTSGEALLTGTGIGSSANQDFVSSAEDSINQDFTSG